jgi:glycosyltransferase involved in cell wall biosynthesis
MGLPVISTPVGGITDIIVEGSTGYFVPVDDTGTLADRIRKLCSSPGLRLEMGLKGRARAESVFSVDIHVEVILDLLHRAAKRLPHDAKSPLPV